METNYVGFMGVSSEQISVAVARFTEQAANKHNRGPYKALILDNWTRKGG